MGLEFIIGAASCDRETPLVEKARDWLIKDNSHEVFYLVPNHIKFETEVSVLSKLKKLSPYVELDRMASLQLQVFSFTRLAWYYLQNEASYQEEQLSEASNLMLIRKVLMEEEASLQVFKGEVKKAGFIQQVADLFKELAAGNVETTDLHLMVEALGNSPKEKDFKTKLTEFYLLFEAYQKKLSGKTIGMTEQISQLAAYLPNKDLSKVMFVVTGFSRFTAKERELIETLVLNAAEVKINLVLDKPYTTNLPEPHNMFFDAGQLYYDFYQFSRKNKIKLYRDTIIKAKLSTDLGTLDHYWTHIQEVGGAKQDLSVGKEQIKILEFGDTYSEMRGVAGEIRRLVSSGKYRYKDIEILTRDIDMYDKIAEAVLSSYDVPFYINNELSMKHHPLLEMLVSMFNIHKHNYRYADIMRFLRTELVMPSVEQVVSYEEWQAVRNVHREKVDLTENVILAYGYEGFYWTQEKDWLYITYDYEEGDIELDSQLRMQMASNQVRRSLRDLLVPFYKEIESAKTGRQGAILLYQFLVDSGVASEVGLWRKFAIEEGALEEAKVHEQTWQALMKLLDDYVAILGDDPFDFSEFIVILTTGLEGLTYSKVPTTIDQVTLSAIDMIHEQKNKVTFLIGMTDQTFPKKIENKTLFSDDERQMVAGYLEEGKFLSKQVKADLIKEPYIAYLAFHSTSDKLFLSYPRGIEGKKDIKPSPYLRLLSNGLNIETIKEKPLSPSNFDKYRISTYRNLLSDLLPLKQLSQLEGEQLAPEYVALEKQLTHNESYQLLTQKLFASLTAKNIPENLRPESVDALYSSTIHGSVSKIENFNACQYKYFMTYGLKLKERDTFELSPAAAGDFYHDALDQLFKVLIKEQLVLSELTSDELKGITENVLQGVIGDARFAILSASPRMNYIRHQLSQTIQRVSQALREQSRRTGMSTMQTEILFGQIAQKTGINGLKIALPDNKSLDIRGKIDRLDKISIGEKDYLAVVDYKSSQHTFDYRDAYFGLTMQMITYLDVALQNAAQLVGTENVKPAGAFYLQVKNPIHSGGLSDEKLEKERLKEFSYNGLLLDDNQLLDRLDRTLDEDPKSLVFPYNQKKNGDYTSRQFVSETEIDQLIKKNRENFKAAGTEIFEGSTKLNPANRDNKKIACGFCPYRSICQFDVLLKENNYNKIEPLKKEEVMARLKKDQENTTEGVEGNDNRK